VGQRDWYVHIIYYINKVAYIHIQIGYVHFTGIWKAMGNSKSDIVKLVDSNPELGTKKIRGGFLRIQGTW
jgi:hypothetical protein